MQNTRKQVRRVLVITLILNITVAAGKIVLGIISGALAITADGFHSLVDSSGNIVGLIANSIADKPPDDQHPYGHRRFETLAALFIGGMLLLTAWEIVQGAIEHFEGGDPPEITPLTFAVMLGTLVINIFVSRYQIREGRRLRSEILIADAAHTSTDVFVTISVLGSMVLVAIGWLWADTVAALVVVVLIGRAAWQIVRKTGSILVDTAPYPPEHLSGLVEDIPSVQKVVRARSRGTPDAAFIDIDVQVAPETTADHTENIADAIRKQLHANLDGITEIEVHFAPHYTGKSDYALTARACADALGLATHEVRITGGVSDKVLEMHVEVPPGQTLGKAHEMVSQLEHDVQLKLPDIDRVVTHIEPAQSGPALMSDARQKNRARSIEVRVLNLLQERYPDINWHDLNVYYGRGGFSVTLHATLPPETPIESAHNIAESAETLLRSEILQLARVTIHTEPFDH